MLPHIETAIERYLSELKVANETLYARIQELEQAVTEHDTAPAVSAETQQEERRMRSRIQAQIQMAMNALDRLETEREALETRLSAHVPDDEQRDTLLDTKHKERLGVVRAALEMASSALTVAPPASDEGEVDSPPVTLESRKIAQA